MYASSARTSYKILRFVLIVNKALYCVFFCFVYKKIKIKMFLEDEFYLCCFIENYAEYLIFLKIKFRYELYANNLLDYKKKIIVVRFGLKKNISKRKFGMKLYG